MCAGTCWALATRWGGRARSGAVKLSDDLGEEFLVGTADNPGRPKFYRPGTGPATQGAPARGIFEHPFDACGQIDGVLGVR